MIENSLLVLSRLLDKHFGQKVVILMDEYDVPLDKAYNKGYYDEMFACIRGMFHNSMKTNDALEFAVITGCLRVAKESIFTGLNNPKMFPFDDVRMTEYFGFNDKEVVELLSYYGRMDRYDTVRQWYDGYQFGKTEIYCPWDVISYCDILLDEKDARPRNFWANTSSNEILRRLTERSDDKIPEEIKQLIAGKTAKKENFYHGIILGLLVYKDGWVVCSNKEAGEGYSDIFVGVEKEDVCMILKIKYPDEEEESDLESGCLSALAQMDEKLYEDAAAGYDRVIKYGIACRRKRCMIRMAD